MAYVGFVFVLKANRHKPKLRNFLIVDFPAFLMLVNVLAGCTFCTPVVIYLFQVSYICFCSVGWFLENFAR